MKSAVQDLIEYWKSQGIRAPMGNSDDAILEFEAQNNVHLPADMREYFRATNGMPGVGRGCDNNGFRFWPLNEVAAVPVRCGEKDVSLPESAHLEQHFLFADYFEWSWAYAIDLSGRDPGGQPVIHIGTLEPKTVARSFSQFLELYLRDAKDLYVVSQPSLEVG
jgi:hypothetical protein